MYNEFLQHLEHREGNVDYVYLDTLGKPTCGVGHLLTQEECRQYNVGDTVSQRLEIIGLIKMHKGLGRLLLNRCKN